MVHTPSSTGAARCPFHHAPKPTEASAALARQHDTAHGLIKEGQPQRAIDLLTPAACTDSSGKTDALIGDAYFLMELYDDAERSYRVALNRSPKTAGWKDKVEHAASNAMADIEKDVPDPEHFNSRNTRERALAGPDLPDVPQYPRNKIQRTGFDRFSHALKTAVGNATGEIGSAVFTGLTKLTGKLSGANGEQWTNWYEAKPEILQVLKLAYMRETLFENNLVNPYPPGEKTAFYKTDGEPPAWVRQFRTPDGSWNHLKKDPDGKYDPMVGAAFTRFYRNVGDDKGLDSLWPRKDPGTNPVNVREISRVLFTREGPMKEVPFLNMLAAGWIQFMVHDWVSHGENRRDSIDFVPLPKDDPAREKYHTDFLAVAKTAEDPTRMPSDQGRPPTYINEVTHWWDGSQIYGSDKETQAKLRSGSDGKMKLTEDGRLPVDPETGVEMTGFNRNWWVGLSVFHTLFAKEHNAICDKLKRANPDWDDERLFQTARIVNAAVMAKIHTVEWTPAILPNKTLNRGMNANWYGLLTQLFDKNEHKKAVSEINVRNRELGGIIGNPSNVAAKYGLSEEFTAVYRLHTLLPDALKIMRQGSAADPVDVPVAQTRMAGSSSLTDRVALSDLLYSMGNQAPGQLVHNNYPKFLQELSVPGAPFQDVGAIDVYRDRERGVPNYNQLRRELSLKPIDSFDDISDDTDVVDKLRQLYGTDEAGKDKVEDIDLLVGTLCEGHRPDGFGFGETLFQVFILNASWRLLGDRFYTDDYNEETYTKEGLDWVDEATFKSVMLRHMPELEESGLGNIANAFEPWDEGELDPARHPLRAFDSNLSDPWKGDKKDEG